MAIYGVFGAGGHGRETMPLLRAMLAARGMHDARMVFVVEGQSFAGQVNGHDVLSPEAFFGLGDELYYNVAIGDSRVRQRISDECERRGARACTIIAPSAIVLDSTQIGEGSILSPHAVVTSNVIIGRSFHANIMSYVTHDCVIGDYVTFGPGAKCNGTVHIGSHAYVGSGAMIRQGRRGRPLTIGEGAVVGMGAVVLHDVPPYTTVVGNPARILEK